MDRPWLFPVAAIGVLVGFVVPMILLNDDGRRQVELPQTISVGGYFLEHPGSLELVSATGVEDGAETLTFETYGATCSVVSTSQVAGEPPGTKEPAVVVAHRTGDVMHGSEYNADGSLTVRLLSHNGPDVIDVSCGDPATTRVFAQLLWEP